MKLPRRRSSRPRGRARLAPVGDFPDTGESVTDILERARPASYDGTTITFGGASNAGLPDTAPLAHHLAALPGYEDADIPEPVARLRAEPRYRPPQQPPPAGYAATTGPMPAIGRPAVSIGDALTHDDHWGPMLAPLPCGHCGTPPPVPGGILDRTRIIGHVNWLAAQAGWKHDVDIIWTCPDCQQDKAWKARQGQLEVRWPDGGYCYRHDAGDPDADCTCPATVIAADVMLTSRDYLNTGRAISIQILTEDAKAGRR
jgi:rubredoxin